MAEAGPGHCLLVLLKCLPTLIDAPSAHRRERCGFSVPNPFANGGTPHTPVRGLKTLMGIREHELHTSNLRLTRLHRKSVQKTSTSL